MDVVELKTSDSIATVTLNRPGRHNALNAAVLAGLHEALSAIAADTSVGAVILQGNGPSFCSGLDFRSFLGVEGLQFGHLLDSVPGHDGNYVQHVATGWAELDVPVVAAVHGSVLGGGLQIALGADLRVCASSATLSLLTGCPPCCEAPAERELVGQPPRRPGA